MVPGRNWDKGQEGLLKNLPHPFPCIKPIGTRTHELADGGKIVLEIGVAKVDFMGEVVGATIIFGQDDIEPILGVTALESVGIEVDPQNQRLKRLPAVRLK